MTPYRDKHRFASALNGTRNYATPDFVFYIRFDIRCRSRSIIEPIQPAPSARKTKVVHIRHEAHQPGYSGASVPNSPILGTTLYTKDSHRRLRSPLQPFCSRQRCETSGPPATLAPRQTPPNTGASLTSTRRDNPDPAGATATPTRSEGPHGTLDGCWKAAPECPLSFCSGGSRAAHQHPSALRSIPDSASTQARRSPCRPARPSPRHRPRRPAQGSPARPRPRRHFPPPARLRVRAR